MATDGRVLRMLSLVVLILSMLLAAPASTIAKPSGTNGGPGNSGAAKMCKDLGYQRYQDDNGKPFTNAGQCTRFAAQGGKLLPISTAKLWIELEGYDDYQMSFVARGEGLKVGTYITMDISYRDGSSDLGDTVGQVQGDGTFAFLWSPRCEDKMGSITLYATAADDSALTASIDVPC